MQLSFNAAALAHLTQAQLYGLLANYRSRLNIAGEAERPAIKAAISSIEYAIAHKTGPR